ncbi:MAG TPA: cytochrome b5-like heme/steroid binding domain-containing protein, partial [Herpetosiphonaceae bacterium]|nr:cytochrome b5-like heme/steroid binding domain-containing protein [Herpetosiphonaceae bacterium]
AKAVMDALKAVVHRFSEGDEEQRVQVARRRLYRLAAEDRYMQDIFTTYTGAHIENKREIDASEVVLHNNAEDGYWMIIDGRVYDLTEFAHLHPGGFKIIRDFAGMDATQPYQKVRHHVNPEVDSLLGMYEIGKVRRLNFGATWGTAIGPSGLHFVSLEDAYRLWIRLLYFVAEIENTLHNEFSLRREALTYDETRTAVSLSPFKLQQLIRTHQRFVDQFVMEAFGEPVEQLWAIISGLCEPKADVRWIKTAIAAIRQSQAAPVEHLSDDLLGELSTLGQADPPPDLSALQSLSERCELLEHEDRRFMRELRLVLRGGLQVFEAYERDTLSSGRSQLLAAVKQMPALLEAYYRRVCSGRQALG